MQLRPQPSTPSMPKHRRPAAHLHVRRQRRQQGLQGKACGSVNLVADAQVADRGRHTGQQRQQRAPGLLCRQRGRRHGGERSSGTAALGHARTCNLLPAVSTARQGSSTSHPLTAGRPLRSSSRQLRELRFRCSGRPAYAWASNRPRNVRHTSASRHLCDRWEGSRLEGGSRKVSLQYATPATLPSLPSRPRQLPYRSFHDPCAARPTIFSRHPSGSCSSLSLPCSVCSRVRGAILPCRRRQ